MRIGPVVAGGVALAAMVAGVTVVPTGSTPEASAATSSAPRSAADGILGSFSPLGEGVNANVLALVARDDTLMVGGDFTAPTASSSGTVAAWAPSGSGDDTWQSVGTTFNGGSFAYALAATAANLYVGGANLNSDDTYLAARVAGTWGGLGSGVSFNVNALTTSPDDTVYAGGLFASAGGVGGTAHVASWNGSSWSSLAGGTNDAVAALAVAPDGTLYAGGLFTSPAPRIAKWNGSAWSPLGSGTNNPVQALAPLGSGVFAAGTFSDVGSAVAWWNGSSWSPLGPGLSRVSLSPDGRALAIDPARSVLYVAGIFDGAGGVTSPSIAAWDIAVQEWIPFRWGGNAASSGLNADSYALAVDDSTVIVGGSFTGPSGESWNGCANGGTLRCIARWTWDPPQGSNSITASGGSQITITGEGFIGVPPSGGVQIGGTAVTYTRTSTTSITATAPAGVFTNAAITVDGVGGVGNVGTFSTYVPPPPPVYPPSAPTDATAAAGDARATVTWSAPSSSGSFPVTSYQVESIPAGGSCLSSTLTCDATGLTNGTSYIFRVRALNGAGWSDWSSPSNAVTPEAPPPPPTPSIVITGSRGEGNDARTVYVDGTAMHLTSQQVQAWVRLAGQPSYRQGITVPVGSDSRFSWKRVTGKKTYVFFVSGDVRSNRVVIPAA